MKKQWKNKMRKKTFAFLDITNNYQAHHRNRKIRRTRTNRERHYSWRKSERKDSSRSSVHSNPTCMTTEEEGMILQWITHRTACSLSVQSEKWGDKWLRQMKLYCWRRECVWEFHLEKSLQKKERYYESWFLQMHFCYSETAITRVKTVWNNLCTSHTSSPYEKGLQITNCWHHKLLPHLNKRNYSCIVSSTCCNFV